MPLFSYTARDSAGKAVAGTLDAVSMPQAIQQLRADGKYPVSVRAAASEPVPQGEDAAEPPVAGRADIKISRSDVIGFSTQLSVMMDTGVTLTEALDCIAAQTQKPVMRQLLKDMIEQVQGGNTFSDALARHPRSFPRVFVALMRASEKSGLMSKLLNRAVGYLRDEQETIRRVRGALTYPGIMLGFALTTTVFLLTFVLPRFTVIYANKKAALPAPTKILMGMSDFLAGNWLGLLIGLAAGVGLLIAYFRSASGSRVWHYLQLNMPLLGPLFRKVHLSRGLRMVGTMAGAGVTLTDCVATATDLCSNSYFRDLWTQVGEQIQAGRQLSDPLFASALVPRSVSQMIYSGEKSGRLGLVMEQVATYSEAELKEQIANLTRYIEPAMIIIMGLIIGGVALALLLPIFTISKVMSAA
jgi:type IV pilus assembly protein PilC